MNSASIPVDLFNPGQVFACYGLMELAEVLIGPTNAGFDWSRRGNTTFLLQVDSQTDPITAALEFLQNAELETIVPSGSEGTEKWQVESRYLATGDAFPVPRPASPAALPATLRHGEHVIAISSWGEGRKTGELGTHRDNVKFWAGSGGYPGAALLRDALSTVRPQISAARQNPFAISAPQSSSLRFDWRRDYIPIDIGFSLNEHGAIQPRGYPLVEILAAIGLAHARPLRIHKLKYRYSVIGRSPSSASEQDAVLPSILFRAALGTAQLPFLMRNFVMNLDWPGQENQARCITTVYEETAP